MPDVTTVQLPEGSAPSSSAAPGSVVTPSKSTDSAASSRRASVSTSSNGAIARIVSIVRRPCASASTATGSIPCRAAQRSHARSTATRESISTPSRSKRIAPHLRTATPRATDRREFPRDSGRRRRPAVERSGSAPASSGRPIRIAWSPPSNSCSSSQASQATVPPRTGTSSISSCSTPASFSSPLAFVAKRRASSSCSAPRMLTQKRPECRTASSVFEVRSSATSTSSGSSESEVSAFVVAPRGPVSPRLVITATPVAQWDISRRSSRGSIVVLTPRSSHNGHLQHSARGRAKLRRRRHRRRPGRRGRRGPARRGRALGRRSSRSTSSAASAPSTRACPRRRCSGRATCSPRRSACPASAPTGSTCRPCSRGATR